MTTEELLKPRYQVIADYPGRLFRLGQICSWEQFTMDSEEDAPIYFFENFTHLFRKLNWWEERKPEELESVEYVKTLAGNSVRKVQEINTFWDKVMFEGGKVRSLKKWIPATREEYEAFINSKTPQP